MLKVNALLVLTCSALLALPAAAERQWPDTTYSCQVVTATGAPGLISIQTLSHKAALTSVIGKPALTRDGMAQTTSVVQCLERGTGKQFSDLGFRGWTNTLVE